ncbi:hypothetical protein [Methanosarcina acetivorans]|uniref:Uncharacterized protein n=1 Tax=Methanosarcina acetivorans (strain ATCC 35395 / DSM 2834 / JCM 12185 / C2A) TaxID=188937 RepID=Q8TM66_METAC|nr:hypothetical protein [Methanosarcina acetivorans]AAM06181.1 predicted protein [Methanosarcina acetivorans C2A]
MYSNEEREKHCKAGLRDFLQSSFYRSEKGKNLDETYFEKFDKERICIDKVFFVVYDDDYVCQDHPFDKELRDKFIQHVKRSRVSKGRFEQVLRKEFQYSAWELQLRGGRTMYFHVNVIHYLQQIHDIRPSNVIYDDNFLPVDSKLTILDFIKALRDFKVQAMDLYKEIVFNYWGVELQQIKVKLVQVELPFEVYPASVEDIALKLYSKGISFRKYNTQSGTIYLNQVETDNSVSVPERKYDKEDPIDSVDLKPDIHYLNKINSGKSRRKIQLKIYQKTFGLARIELTIYSEDAKQLFEWSLSDKSIAEDLINFVHFNLGLYDINVDRYDRSLDDVVRFLSQALKEPEDLIYQLKDLDIFEACEANRSVRQRLTRKGILIKLVDSDNVQKRGQYIVNPIIREFLNMYKPKGNEHFVKKSLYPGL